MSKYVVGQRYVINTYFPAAFATDNTPYRHDDTVARPTVVDSEAKLRALAKTATRDRSAGGGGRCYEADFCGDAVDGTPIFKPISRLRVTLLDMDETVEGNAADFETVCRFVRGETDALEKGGPADAAEPRRPGR